MSPLSPGSKYRVNIAADNGQVPRVVTSSRNIDLLPLDAFLLSESRSLRAILVSRDFILSTVLVLVYVTAVVLYWKRFRRRHKRLLLVGKLVERGGLPISGATILVNVEAPANRAHTYDPVVTDNEGDFIVGTARKQPGLLGTIRVEHSHYAPSTIAFRSPIILVIVDPQAPQSTVNPQLLPRSEG